MLIKMLYLSGTVVSRSERSHFTKPTWECPVIIGTFGLGYEPIEEDLEEIEFRRKRKNAWKRSYKMCPFSGSLNGYFCREGETIPYRGFREPVTCTKTGKEFSGFEIFTDVLMKDEQKPGCSDGMKIEDFMQSNLFEEIAVITTEEQKMDFIRQIKEAAGVLDNWYTKEKFTA